ncbi:hypothetical protein CHELA1G11_10255 [Hyphomicrobiales bacterium]|nr:hypothetical protein CHELA1G11_10255 [Hyphomicrobiales bacterium]CAH1675973.1 hypothetical protein CHELA1G2_14052 [Hyphomicrobiales bacterium]
MAMNVMVAYYMYRSHRFFGASIPGQHTGNTSARGEGPRTTPGRSLYPRGAKRKTSNA